MTKLQVNEMRRCILWLYAAPLLCCGVGLASANSDVVIFGNGDRLTGEVKSLERGKLRFKTAATDTIAIEWDDVANLSSVQNLQVETTAGARYLGTLVRSAEPAMILVRAASESVTLRMADVVLMTPIEDRGLERLDGDVSLGYNFAKASEVQQLQFALDLEARTETRIFGMTAAHVQSDSEDSATSQRQSLDLSYTRLRANRWVTGAVARLDRNDELGLDLRTSIGAGGGRYLRQTNSATLLLAGGLQLSRENVSGDVADEDTIEAFATLEWDWFRYDTPELDLSTQLSVFPNLSETGRVRAEFDIRLRWEMIEDLFWALSLYESYDSDPVAAAAEKSDYGIVTSIGWEF